MIEKLKARQCIGCGRLEEPQNCIGVCQDRRVELVYAADYEAVTRTLAAVRAERDALRQVVARVAGLDGAFAPQVAAVVAEARASLARAEVLPAARGDDEDAGAAARGSHAAVVRSADGMAEAERARRPSTLYVR